MLNGGLFFDENGSFGGQLVSAIESWARAAGAERISVTPGAHRAGAHAFYERLAYERSGLRLTKRLT